MRKWIFFALLIVCLATSWVSAQNFMGREPRGFFNNFSSNEGDYGLEQKLQRIEEEYGVEVTIVFLPNAENQDETAFSRTLFNAWGIGKKSVQNGILVLVLTESRKLVVLVGDGVSLSEEEISVIAKEPADLFSQEKMGQGIGLLVDQLELRIRQLTTLPTSERMDRGQRPFRFSGGQTGRNPCITNW